MLDMAAPHALQLFCRHAFGTDSPLNDYCCLSNKIVSSVGGLPLAIEVIGSSLKRKNKAVWKETLDNLKNVPEEEILNKLKISYDGLDNNQKHIFLDISCLFFNEKTTNPIYMWDHCQLNPRRGIEVLTERCLIKILDNDKFWMHDQLIALGRKIVRDNSHGELGKQSRLWIAEEALDIIRIEERMDKVIALDIDGFDYSIEIKNQEFERLQNLRFLKLCNGTFVGDFARCRSKLTWIYWRCPHRDFRADNIYLNHLVVFELGSSGFKDDSKVWDLIKRAHNLRVISLTECNGLTTIPDFSKCLHLQRLTLAHCSRLKRIQSFIRHLQSLIELDIEGCIGLTELPEELGALAKLQRFSLQGCSGLCELPSSFGNLTSLIELDLSSTSIGKSKKITRCNLRWIERLSRLKRLDLNLSNICALPELASLSRLEELTVSELTVSEEWVEFKNHPPSLKHLRITMGTSSIELIAPSNSKAVLKLDVCDNKDKRKAMKIVSRFAGVKSVEINLKDQRLLVTRDIDAVEMMRKLKWMCKTDGRSPSLTG